MNPLLEPSLNGFRIAPLKEAAASPAIGGPVSDVTDPITMVKPNAEAALVLSTQVSIWIPRTVIIAPSKYPKTTAYVMSAA